MTRLMAAALPVLVAGTLVLAGSMVLGLVSPAIAVSCPQATSVDQLYNYWQPSDDVVAGFRSPIVLRKDGVACAPGSPLGANSSWVGIASQTNNGISQIGWIQIGGSYCRFHEYNNNHGTDTGPVTYGNCTDGSATEIWFKVEQWFNSSTGLYYWGMFDCGSSWSVCTREAGGPRTSYLGNVFGAVSAETDYGGSECTDTQMGSSGFRVRFGEVSTDPIEGQRTYGGSYAVRSLAFVPDAGCSFYISPDHDNYNMKTYDSRN